MKKEQLIETLKELADRCDDLQESGKRIMEDLNDLVDQLEGN